MQELVYKSGDALYQEINSTVVGPNAVALWNLGQEGYVIKGQTSILYIDPYLSNSIEENSADLPGTLARDFPPPLDPGRIEHATAIICTHFHEDHLDMDTLRPLAAASAQASCIVPASHLYMIRDCGVAEERIIPARPGVAIALDEFSLTPILAKHPIFEEDEAGNPFYLGFVIQGNGVTIYHSGDTVFFPELLDSLRGFSIDIAMVNANGRDWMRDERNIIGNMNYREAIAFVARLGADLFVPMHYDLFAWNRENPAYIVDYLFTHHRAQKFHMFAIGERFIYHR